MAFIDELQFHIKAGNGGDGVVRWLHEKTKDHAGAAGGDGGKGGDVYVRGVRDLNILGRYRNVKEFESARGEDGMKSSMHGADGKDLIIDLPIGSVITNVTDLGGPATINSGRKIHLLEEGELIKLLKGGRGGLGNEHFKASTNIRPLQQTNGRIGEEGDFKIELELVADAGFIGLPNAGKSSLLNALTNADAKVGAYQFTTLEPNLGALKGGFVIADIPGLIEGASEGKGLGHKFLRHVKRTKILFHLISLENLDGAKDDSAGADGILAAYKTVRTELSQFGQTLDEKPETIILTKTDTLGGPANDKKIVDAAVKKAEKILKKLNPDIITVSILDDASVKKLSDEIVKRLRK
jgi:GTP-binding protein